MNLNIYFIVWFKKEIILFRYLVTEYGEMAEISETANP